jgi:hypothetical protein
MKATVVPRAAIDDYLDAAYAGKRVTESLFLFAENLETSLKMWRVRSINSRCQQGDTTIGGIGHVWNRHLRKFSIVKMKLFTA